MKKSLAIVLSSLFISPFFFLAAQASEFSALKSLPIQDGGRVKPFDTFAREHLSLIFGKETYQGRAAIEIVLTWVLQPSEWETKEIFQIKNDQVKQKLKFPTAKDRFSLQEILNNERLPLMIQELQAERETKRKFDPYFQAAQRIENQIFVFREIAAGRMIKLVPPKEGDAWVDLSALPENFQTEFMKITESFVSLIAADMAQDSAKKVTAAAALQQAVTGFEALARAENPALYPTETRVKVETHYNDLHPFKWSYIGYLLAGLLALLAWIFNKDLFYKLAWAAALVGLSFNIYGFGLRTFLTERAPVTNMYETVVWVGFGTMVFALIMEAMYRWKFLLLIGSFVSAFLLVLADMAPVVLDSTLQPLEPVLRSNYWLTVHVMTITISYGAFFLAFGLGDFALGFFLSGEEKHQDKIKALSLGMYRCVQIGVAFLAPGIILGGIWADYSWGRFWGWDPKETWALIALLGYIALLHGRMAGMLKDFGMAAGSILAFSLVIMAWYGVNFVLGAGLHSYGFGAGGVEYVSSFVALHILYVIFTSVVINGRRKAKV